MPTADEAREAIAQLMAEKESLPERMKQAARDAREAGLKPAEIAFRFEVTTTTIYNWLREERP